MLSQTPSSSQVDARRVKKKQKKTGDLHGLHTQQAVGEGGSGTAAKYSPWKDKENNTLEKKLKLFVLKYILKSSIETATSTNFIAVNVHNDTRKQVDSSFVFP